MGVGDRGQAGQDVAGGIESGGHVERPGGGADGGDAVESKGPHGPAGVVVTGDVPAAVMKDQPVRVEVALAAVALPAGVRQMDRMPVAGRLGEHQEHLRPGRGGPADRSGDLDRGQQCLDPPGQVGRQYPVQLRGGALGCRVVGRDQPSAPSGGEAEGGGHGLVVGEHERWQLVATRELVPAVAATARLDRDPEVAEVGRVAAEGALIDAASSPQPPTGSPTASPDWSTSTPDRSPTAWHCPDSACCPASPSRRSRPWPRPCRCTSTWSAPRGGTRSCPPGTGRCSVDRSSWPPSCTGPNLRSEHRRVTAPGSRASGCRRYERMSG